MLASQWKEREGKQIRQSKKDASGAESFLIHYCQLGGYHTLELVCSRYFKLDKNCWDPLALQLLQQSTSEAGKYEVAAVVLAEACAYVCNVADATRIRVLKKVEENLPKKKIGSAYEKAIEKFYEHVMEAMLEFFDFSHLKAIILGSPQNYQVSNAPLRSAHIRC